MPTPSLHCRWRRPIVGLVLASLLLSLSGCVYLRLLRFKNQLKDFDEYVLVDKESGLGLEFSKPVLADDDFVFITESQPTSIAAEPGVPSAEVWVWLFRKQQASDADRPFGVEFRTRFENNLLTRIDFDPRIIEVIPPDFVVALFQSMGKAKINKLRRSASSNMTREQLEGIPLPSLLDVEKVMGEPSETASDEGKLVHTYIFNFYNPENDELSGQFKIAFRSEDEALEKEIAGFSVSAKAR